MRALLRIPLCALGMLWATGLAALDLDLPGAATMTRERIEEAGTYRLPIGPYNDGQLPVLEVEGHVTQQSWRLEAQGMTTLQIIDPLRETIRNQGYEVLLDCSGPECGGFDFRFNTRVLPAPDMFVDLFDYRFLSARKSGEESKPDYLSLMVSRSGATNYVQLMHVQPNGGAALSITANRNLPRAGSDTPLAKQLLAQGHIILSDLDFSTGSSDLGPGPFASLQALAGFLKSDPARRIALVGHTDTVGALDRNIALSKRRAASVLERLVSAHDVPRTQIAAEGMGYLAPIASNLTAEGREANRRVEAVLLNAE
ncbi:OmpA family protein [uncultured Roseovarius sp.]|uniref:OmpA family protein n=1 Tax=uncultured Roseovarius sp. TaxID=293344 RepID=UPI0025E45318|nr:OmpA family protein [uncultured Roseovarius sp.]